MLARRNAALLAAALAYCAVCASAQALEIAPGADVRAAMQGLHPGDTLILDGGAYDFSGYFELDIAGTAAQPVVIRAQTGQLPMIRNLDTSQNIANFVGAQFLTIDGIEFTGGSRGLRFIGGNDVTVKNCRVHGTVANAIAANDDGYSYARFQFIHNEIDHTGETGEAFYLGCNLDACRIHDSLVANNYIHDLNGASITQGDGIEIKKGSYANIVRDNVIRDTGYPGITLYDVNGNGAPNVIERNIVWKSGDNGIQVTADAIVRNNIVLGAAGSAFASNAVQNGSAANLVIVNNTFLMPSGNGIKLNSVSGSVTIANNAIYAPNGRAIDANGTLGGIVSVANAGQGVLNGVSAGFNAGGSSAADFVAGSLSGMPPQNLLPKSALLVGKAATANLPGDDFDAHPRGAAADIGAYRTNAGGAPGWTITPGFKVLDEIFFDGFGA
jgi:Right handed beta helix region